MMSMRFLGIDYGTKNVGIAVSDEGGRIALPFKVIVNRGGKRLLSEIKDLVKKEKAEVVILGLPLYLDGTESAETRKVKRFAELLKKEVSIPVALENEMLTTKMVLRAGVRQGSTDAASAALILQAYLDKLNT